GLAGTGRNRAGSPHPWTYSASTGSTCGTPRPRASGVTSRAAAIRARSSPSSPAALAGRASRAPMSNRNDLAGVEVTMSRPWPALGYALVAIAFGLALAMPFLGAAGFLELDVLNFNPGQCGVAD